ncbi:MAG TPA: prephenate dehydratase domain-containing protein, partial [Acidobacteriaceae bacterium]|nr:prephenate dehydratase domain-containing protein [Acidobacteriaceae bacterium]
MSSSAPIRVAIQGIRGSFSHEAALAMLPGAEIVPCTTAAQVFAAMQGSKDLYSIASDVAVIPIENSLAGSVIEFYDLLSRISR